ncbi:choice-of-anchor tandem repeat GloVer-containing protein [Terriglobus roseus]|uniref:Gloeo_Verruco repeat-containing protein n=1 Tax=Terriglobus roseus TaxID=392734 RepID=A0A1G7KPL5_9BACT|nr:choice-of-anchor tandem repeat GloVer-containing protein [Terriglobus roseus]SDF39147.1 Gloeo_Verruco repeat-containing protein [Terriglobus roseus]
MLSARVRPTFHAIVLSIGLLISLFVLSLPAYAQPKLTTLSSNLNDTWEGAIQASDGNFYTTSIITMRVSTPYSCEDNPADTCSYITKIKPDGTATIFHTFHEVDGQNNVDGMSPNPIIEASDGNFYGSALIGGAGGIGTIFKITPAGTFSVIFTFTHAYTNGIETSLPYGGYPGPLVEGSDGFLYGTTQIGGPVGTDYGTIFKVSKTGAMTVLHEFPGSRVGDARNFPDGLLPISLIQGADGNFYGTTLQSPQDSKGNFLGLGTIFSISSTGSFTTLHNLAIDGSEGTQPFGPLTQGPDGSFYGTNKAFGYTGTPDAQLPAPLDTYKTNGNFYKISNTGNFQVLYNFTGQADGRDPSPYLTLGSDGNFYGATRYAGSNTGCAPFSGCGVLFQMQPSGTETVLYSFLGTKDSGIPYGPLVQANDGSFYGTNELGLTGTENYVPGSFFNLALKPALKGPIQITFSPTTVNANQPVTLKWSVSNAYSTTAQQCHASVLGMPAGSGAWSGPQYGAATSSGFGGSATLTPTQEGTYTYVLNCGGTETGTGTLVVGNLLTVQTTSLPSATVGNAYSQALAATGGTPPYTWSQLSGVIPSGLSFDPTTGVVSGTPDQFVDASLSFQVKDSASQPNTANGIVTLSVKSGLIINTISLPKATVGVKYTQALSASGGKAPYSWSLLSGKLPDGIVFSPSSGVFSGTPTTPAAAGFSVQVKDSEGTPAIVSGSVSLDIVPPTLAITTTTVPTAQVGKNYSVVLGTTGGTAPFTWSLTSGTLPKGIALNAASGILSGTPQQFGNATISVKVTDSSTPQMTDSATYPLTVISGLDITDTTVGDGKVGTQYSAGLTPTGGTQPYKWSIINGALPAGLTLNADSGVISGTPTTQQVSTFTIQILDNEGTPAATTKTFNINIAAAALAVSTTTLSSSAVSTAVGQSVTFTATVSATTGVPNGVVTFYNGSTPLGTGNLNNSGVATFTTTFTSAGIFPITAVYAGNGTSTGSTSAVLSETVVAVGISAAFSPDSLTITSGSSGTLTLTLTPTGGYTGTVTFSCGTLPAHVTCSFAPPSVTITSSTTTATDTLTINTASTATTAMLDPTTGHRGSRGSSLLALALLLPCSMFALLRPRTRRLLPRLLMLAVVCCGFVAMTGLSGCGSTSPNASPGTYTVPVTLTLSSASTQTINATIVVK